MNKLFDRKYSIVVSCMTLVIACMFGDILVRSVAAAEYPARPVTLIVPGPAGSATDVVARQVAEMLSSRLGQRVVIDNRAGASGAIAARFVTKAQPDGYTVLFCNSATHGGNAALMSDLGYDPVKDFAPVVRVATVPFILVVNPGMAVQSVKDLVDLAKANPGKFRIGFASFGGYNHLAGELFQQQTGIELLSVPYKGLNEVITGVAGGHIDLGFPTPGESLALIEAGRLRAILVTGTRRLAALPNVPTVMETGLRDSVILGWGGLCAPTGTPAPVISKLNQQTLASILEPAMKADFERRGYEIVANSPEEFGTFIKSEIARISRLVSQRGIRAEQ